MVPEPVGSTHLRFSDARVVMGIVCGYRKLFGVSDEIPDITRCSGGKNLYMGSPILATGKCSGFFGIVPGSF